MSKSKQQIIFIHGGEVFKKYEDYISYLEEKEFKPEKVERWSRSLAEDLGNDFEVLSPSMPSKNNAKYREWKIWFEKIAEYAEDGVILVGHSLGGIFLVKYLTENDFPKKIKALFLAAPPFDDEDSEYSLADFALPEDLSALEERVKNIFVFHSTDDPVVPFKDFLKYKKAVPYAEFIKLEGRGHFLDREFPEIISKIKNI